MDNEQFMESIKSELIEAWKNGDKVVIPMQDVLKMDVISLFGCVDEVPVLRIEIPLLVDDNGYRFSIINRQDEDEK